MGTNNAVFLELIEWFDESGQELVHRIPETGSGEIQFGAQLVVRESQTGVFFYNGRAHDAFGPGRHTLTTANIPILTKALSLPWGFTSPLRAEIYLANMKVFTNLRWGTKDPVAFKDSELGLIRLRAFGMFDIRVIQPVLLINSLIGTRGLCGMDEIEEYLARVIVSRFSDYMGEKIDSIFKLAAKYDELSEGLKKRLKEDFSRYGLGLSQLCINSITPPPEVRKAIDDKGRLSVFDDLNRLIKMKAAMALEKASESRAESGAGLGMGFGMMMPSMLAEAFSQPGESSLRTPTGASSPIKCPECSRPIARESKFCPYCGHHLLVFTQCSQCGEKLAPNARFCSQCGHPVDQKPRPRKCSHCGSENLPESTFCNQCAERLT